MDYSSSYINGWINTDNAWIDVQNTAGRVAKSGADKVRMDGWMDRLIGLVDPAELTYVFPLLRIFEV